MYIIKMLCSNNLYIKQKAFNAILYTHDADNALKFLTRIDALRFAEENGIVAEINIVNHNPIIPCSPKPQPPQQQAFL